MRPARLSLAAAALLLAACSHAPRVGGPRGEAVPPGGSAEAPAPAARLPSDRRPTEAELAAIPDAIPREEPRSLRGNPPFYTVLGKRYQVLASAQGYRERGVASWYGPTFHAKDTSIGEPYDMYGMSAAHKTLPLPAYARVTNLANGRSVVVRVNDRGPFVGNRLIDLSYTAAWKLDMIRAGTAFVEVEALTPASLGDIAKDLRAGQSVPPAFAPLYVQAGAFGVQGNAQRLVARLRDEGFDNTLLLAPAAGASLWRVRIGPVATVTDYDRIANRLGSLGIEARLATD